MKIGKSKILFSPFPHYGHAQLPNMKWLLNAKNQVWKKWMTGWAI